MPDRSLRFAVFATVLALGASTSRVAAEGPLFEKDILPIFRTKCLNCHGAEVPKGGLDLRTKLTIQKGGETGLALHPVVPSKGTLWKQIEADKMPPGAKVKLTEAEKELIFAWVRAGAPDGKGDGSPDVRSNFAKWPEALPAPTSAAAIAADVDRLIDAGLHAAKVPASPPADDAEFLRGATLDLIGRVPTVARTRAFLDSREPDKRAKLIDELLASTEFGRHLGEIWHHRIVPLSAANTRSFDESLYLWLAGQFNQNRPWSSIVSSLLTAEGEIIANRNQKPSPVPTVGFFLANADETYPQPDQIAASVAQLFLGVHLQCAQCHNHPFAQWKQDDFWGLAAFFGRVGYDGDIGQLRTKKQPVILKETAQAVMKGGKKSTFVRDDASIEVPDSKGRVVKARYLDGTAPALKADGPFRPAFAAWATSKENRQFARAGVNRIWAQLFGRGIVSPVNDLHEGNPPSHPELLDLLARQFAAADYDLKKMYRGVCNSAVYQRTSRPLPENKADVKFYSHMALKQLSAEVLHDSAQTVFLGETATFDKQTIPVAEGGKSIRDAGRDQFAFAMYSQEAGEDPTRYTHGVAQALRLMNSRGVVRSDGAQTKPISARGFPRSEAVEFIYLAALSRRPSADEVKIFDELLNGVKDASTGYRTMLWVLLNSSEFVFNH